MAVKRVWGSPVHLKQFPPPHANCSVRSSPPVEHVVWDTVCAAIEIWQEIDTVSHYLVIKAGVSSRGERGKQIETDDGVAKNSAAGEAIGPVHDERNTDAAFEMKSLRAVEWAEEEGLLTVGVTGKQGGRLGQISRYPILVESTHMGHIEEAHFLILHLVSYYFMEAEEWEG